MSRSFHILTVAQIQPEIDGAATSVVLALPPKLSQRFAWIAGQHLTLRLDLNGVDERRSYTISNPPGDQLRITVKRVKNGKVSNHIGDRLRVGDQIEAMPPFGGFTLAPKEKARRTHYFFGAGSGITPLFSMINIMLQKEPHSVAHLIYGNTDAKNILFKDDLQALTVAYPDRFTLRHVLSAPSAWSWFSPWRSGRLNAETIAAAIAQTPPQAQDTQYWICGPGSMNGDVRSALMSIDVPADRIHMESFGAAPTSFGQVTGAVAAKSRIMMSGTSYEVPVDKGQTLLAAAQQAGVDLPHSCQSGVCGACKAQLSEGKVHMAARMALEDAEIDRGDILTCQSVPLTDRVTVRIR